MQNSFVISGMKALAKAHSNIALIKYWGKRNTKLNIPAMGSISLTLNRLFTLTAIEFRQDLRKDRLSLNGKNASPEKTDRVSRFLDIIRHRANIKMWASIISENNFPTGAGLASSASAFASMALAGSRAAGLELSLTQLSELARLGSGSAARSIFGGFVEMKPGKKADGSDAYAVQLAEKDYWNLHLLVIITSESEKQIGSTAGMILTQKTSPYYQKWVTGNVTDLVEMRNAIHQKDFTKLGELTEYSCLKMHGIMLSTRPGLIFWNSTTLSIIHSIRYLRKQGYPVYFTIDAGPQVKVICEKEQVNIIRDELKNNPGVLDIIETGLGPEVSLIGDVA
jgi:diphosphomevalonate decarboxylase